MKHILTITIAGLFLFSCSKNEKHQCYDESLVHDNPCTADCPGIIGCDGETYCNECEAARVGISPQ
jgi:hypothetical protein